MSFAPNNKSLAPSELSQTDLDLDIEQLSVERILGLHVDCDEDAFTVPHKVNSKKGSKEKTIHSKRSVLSAISSVFDPLGLLPNVVIFIRILMHFCGD